MTKDTVRNGQKRKKVKLVNMLLRLIVIKFGTGNPFMDAPFSIALDHQIYEVFFRFVIVHTQLKFNRGKDNIRNSDGRNLPNHINTG